MPGKWIPTTPVKEITVNSCLQQHISYSFSPAEDGLSQLDNPFDGLFPFSYVQTEGLELNIASKNRTVQEAKDAQHHHGYGQIMSPRSNAQVGDVRSFFLRRFRSEAAVVFDCVCVSEEEAAPLFALDLLVIVSVASMRSFVKAVQHPPIHPPTRPLLQNGSARSIKRAYLNMMEMLK